MTTSCMTAFYGCFEGIWTPFRDSVASLFRPRALTPEELVKQLKDNSLTMIKSNKQLSLKAKERIREETSKALHQLKSLFIDQELNMELIAELSQAAYNQGLLEILCEALEYYDFEARKGAVIVFNGLLRRQIGTRWPTVDYIACHHSILWTLLNGYNNKDIALNCGLMLRECIKHECLAQVLTESTDGNIYSLFTFIELPTFDLASDAFATFQELMTRHRMLVAALLTESYERFISEFNKLLASENYVTRRQSLKLLGEILEDSACAQVKRRYLFDSDNLKIIMNLMRDSSPTICAEALKIFRMFIDNPTRAKPVHDILVKNQEKLLAFMEALDVEKGDEEFAEDRHVCSTLISELITPRSESNASSRIGPEPC